ATARKVRSARTTARTGRAVSRRRARAAAVLRAHLVGSRADLRQRGKPSRCARSRDGFPCFPEGREQRGKRQRLRRPQRIGKRCGVHRLARPRAARPRRWRPGETSSRNRADGVRAAGARVGGAVQMTARATPLTMPLSGVRLVEASAGTGKTFTIATLYLRLILERALTPEQIVVATFTRAATAELATRLRKRLRLAADILRADDPARARAEDDGDTQATRAVIAGVLDRNDDDVATLASRARDAELAMDTAVIGTLHGFCHRILSEFGFETGRALGQLELLEDPRALQQEIVKDFWRTCSTDAEAARLLAETWRTPDALALQVRDPRWRGRHIVAGESTQMSAQARRALRQEALARLDAIRNAIAGWDESTLQAADRELAECFDKRGWS